MQDKELISAAKAAENRRACIKAQEERDEQDAARLAARKEAAWQESRNKVITTINTAAQKGDADSVTVMVPMDQMAALETMLKDAGYKFTKSCTHDGYNVMPTRQEYIVKII